MRARCAKGNWWSVETASVADFPQQAKLVEVMDNRDGTLSIIGTQVDHAGPARAPGGDRRSGRDAQLGVEQMAAAGRTLAANDPRAYRNPSGGKGDRNVELMVRNPFAGKGAGLCAGVTAKTTGTAMNGAVLDRRRATVRRAVTKYALKGSSGRVDRYCLVGGGNLRVGYLGDRSVVALSSNRSNRLSGIKVGSSTKTVRRRLRGERAYRAGSFTWYVAERIAGPDRDPGAARQGRADGPGRRSGGPRRARRPPPCLRRF